MTVPSYMTYWGKAAKNDDCSAGDDYHLLPYHCLDVAAVADVWFTHSKTLLSQIAQQLDTDKNHAKSICLFFILLHDLGKFDARFQNFREDIRVKLQGDEWEVDADATYYSHGSCGYRQFTQMYCPNDAMKAVAGHHGFCDVSFPYYPPEADDELVEQDALARQEWIDFCLTFCGFTQVPNVGEIPLLAGLCSVSDWVGSSITNYCTDQYGDLYDYYQHALPRAENALRDTGMIEELKGAGFDYLFSPFKPRSIQSLLAKLPIEPGLVLAEADTGAGKTEFALAHASKLINAGLADGVVFALPTQATANGLFDRIGEAANKLFPDATTTLAHGKSKFLISDESGFLQRSNKRAFLGSVSVATIDQILMGVLGVKHQFVRSFGTRKSVLVIDEVHSFDAYMLGLIQQVLKGQHQSFSSVILLSATMPRPLKETLLATYGGESLSDAYPLVSHTNLTGQTTEYALDDADKTAKKTIDIECWRTEDILPNTQQQEQIKVWLSQGATVGLIVNTVNDAQALYQRFKELSIEQPIDLFHARYTFGDRARIERQVLNDYGKGAQRQGRLLIATQVVEQSLDLDFDVMISQIAPVEFLMQRMGRLWRHDRVNTDLCPRSSAIDKPLFITLLPTQVIEDGDNTDKIKKHYQGSGFVYQNIRLLYRTERYLQARSQLTFPDCYRDAINYVHNEEPLAEEPTELNQLALDFSLKAQGSNYTARCMSNLQSKPLNDVDPRCAMLTREGEMSESVLLLKADGALWLGGDINEQSDREQSTVSLAKKHVRGAKDEKYYCHKAVVAKDISYNHMGVITTSAN